MDLSRLFKPLPLGPLTLGHRLAMAPLTRFRASDDHVPLQPMVSTYYAQRASSLPGTLLISEATFVSPQASGYANVPGLWTQDQLASWKKVTDAVHAKGGYIFVQLWALGRAASGKELQKKGLRVVSASAVRLSEHHAVPEELSEEGIWNIIGEYAAAARSAVLEGGFDGVEIHGANG
jgi:NADPH2 dehydrogenase